MCGQLFVCVVNCLSPSAILIFYMSTNHPRSWLNVFPQKRNISVFLIQNFPFIFRGDESSCSCGFEQWWNCWHHHGNVQHNCHCFWWRKLQEVVAFCIPIKWIIYVSSYINLQLRVRSCWVLHLFDILH